MDAHPTVVINDSLNLARPLLEKAGGAMATALAEQLAAEPHFAEFTITVTGHITDPSTGTVLGSLDFKLPYKIYWDRDPNQRDESE